MTDFSDRLYCKAGAILPDLSIGAGNSLVGRGYVQHRTPVE